MKAKIQGLITAIITPFLKNGDIDWPNLEQLIEFQIASGVNGILFAGTTGESPTLSTEEHKQIIKFGVKKIRKRCLCLVGTGSNNTVEAMELTCFANQAGADAVMLVDPYYNGPSSLEIMREYLLPVACLNPGIEIIPYIIPGRTGCELLPEHLAILNDQFYNINCAKIATGDLEQTKKLRKLCGPNFSIMSGDDDATKEMMLDPEIRADGAISVISNLFPTKLACQIASYQKQDNSCSYPKELHDLLSLVNVITEEEMVHGKIKHKSRNPLPIKSIMEFLGLPAGPCRQPLGKMTRQGMSKVVQTLDNYYSQNKKDFQILSDFFGVDTESNLATLRLLSQTVYK